GDGGPGLLRPARGLDDEAGPFAAGRFPARRMVRSHTLELHQPLPSHTPELHQPPPSHTRELHPPPPSHNGGILLACGVAGLVYGAGYLVVGTAPVLGVAAAGALLAHLGGGAQWTLSTYGLQAAVPDYIRGRVFAADFALVTVTMSLSLMASGALAEVTGSRPPTLV